MTKKRNKRLVLLVMVLALLAACKPSIPSGILSPGDMEDILYDYHVARAMASQHRNSDSPEFNETMYMQAVLKKHGTTQAVLDSSLIYYYGHVDKFAEIYQEVTERLNEEAMSLGASVGALGDLTTMSLTGDTANIWNDATALLLLPRAGFNRVSFELKADSAFKKGDVFQFNLRANYLYKSGMKDALIYAAVRYDNDSVSTHQVHCTVSGFTTLRISGVDDHLVKDIRTFIYLQPSDEDANNMLFLDQIQLVRFHKQRQEEHEAKDTTTVKPLM